MISDSPLMVIELQEGDPHLYLMNSFNTIDLRVDDIDCADADFHTVHVKIQEQVSLIHVL